MSPIRERQTTAHKRCSTLSPINLVKVKNAPNAYFRCVQSCICWILLVLVCVIDCAQGDELGNPVNIDLNLSVRVIEQNLKVILTNNAATPYTLDGNDLSIHTMSHRAFPPRGQEKTGSVVPPKGQGDLTVDLSLESFINESIWFHRCEPIEEKWPAEKPLVGKVLARVEITIEDKTGKVVMWISSAPFTMIEPPQKNLVDKCTR